MGLTVSHRVPALAAHEHRYLRPPALAGVEMVTSVHRGALAPVMVDHRFRFVRMDAGEAEALFGGSLMRFSSGMLFVQEPADVVTPRLRLSRETRHRDIWIDPQLVTRFVTTAFGDGPALRLGRGLLGDGARLAFDALFDAAASGAPPLEQQCRLATFLEVALAAPREPMRPQRLTAPIARARRMLHERVADDVRLEELEAAVGLSRFYLVRRFRAEVGLPPHAYQLALRIDRARALVADGLALADVAAHCGFTDQSHFTRHFRRAIGVAPGAYARSTGVKRAQ